jgi:hypothetical protein
LHGELAAEPRRQTLLLARERDATDEFHLSHVVAGVVCDVELCRNSDDLVRGR